MTGLFHFNSEAFFLLVVEFVQVLLGVADLVAPIVVVAITKVVKSSEIVVWVFLIKSR